MVTREEMRQALEMRHTKKVQDKLEKSHVAVCGLGGLGSAIAFSLARCGVGHLHLIDFDRVDLTNLNRQQYAIEQLGMEKPYALKKEIERGRTDNEDRATLIVNINIAHHFHQ